MSYGATDVESMRASPAGEDEGLSPVWKGLPRSALVVGTVGLWALAFGGTLPSAPGAVGAPRASELMAASSPTAMCTPERRYVEEDDMCNAAAWPVLDGADVVAYESLEEGEPHVSK